MRYPQFLALLAATFLALCNLPLQAAESDAPDAEPTDSWAASRADRIAWWNDARFGMFIHWGLYAIPAGEWEGNRVGGIGEWIMDKGKINVADYEPLAQQFNPTEFDATEWVGLMKEAGCRYFVITTKHHDGFALFRSAVSDYDIGATPFGRGNDRDIMRELADAARAAGIRIGWYHSIMDWHHPDYLPRRGWETRSAEGADDDRYREYLHAQVAEILKNYGEIDVIWFDGEWEATWTHEHGIALHEHCMSLNPRILVNNRVDKGRRGMEGMNKEGAFRGDFGTPEQEIPETGFGEGVFWESCMTMNKTWGFKSYDHDWKSSTNLVQNLIDTASKGGNYLLNVGPTALGEIPQPSQERLRAMGKWLAANGDSIYGTSAGVYKHLDWGRTTTKDLGNGKSALYLHVFEWPEDGKLVVPGLANKVLEASAVDKGHADQVRGHERTAGDVVVLLDGPAWNEHACVVKLIVEGQPDVDQ